MVAIYFISSILNLSVFLYLFVFCEKKAKSTKSLKPKTQSSLLPPPGPPPPISSSNFSFKESQESSKPSSSGASIQQDNEKSSSWKSKKSNKDFRAKDSLKVMKPRLKGILKPMVKESPKTSPSDDIIVVPSYGDMKIKPTESRLAPPGRRKIDADLMSDGSTRAKKVKFIDESPVSSNKSLQEDSTAADSSWRADSSRAHRSR